MKLKRHYDNECLFYLKKARYEWVNVYEVGGYEGDNVRHSWYLPSLETAKRFVSDFEAVGALTDIYIKELQCYVDDVGLIWVKHVHYIFDD